ncbi:4-amino-4-deoxychorismate lyase [Rhodococcus sp. WMMA185]|uniref:aminodeoxychorismate lyase n=1 Tax=Rhodococcus sp. WMMA185 TaxID=679318 RepID=UPI000878CE25|nr:aminodeoxychorismate lyase [Rhodococcus sp. WMMA185]AOW93417.1 4-amino-4-deoxychorismate lyase [Rhodococcus sp. WMMA185]
MSDQVLVTLDHEVRDADAPLLHADDLAVVRGDGVFETLLVRGGRVLKLEQHLNRLEASAHALGLPSPDRGDWRRAVGMAAKEWGSEREGAMRLVLSRGRESGGAETAFVTVGPVSERILQARRDGVSVLTLARGYSVDLSASAPWQLLGAKTLSYATNMAALRYAATFGADDVIFVSSEGNVLEGPRSTVIIARGKTLLTPPPEHGILPGTTQQALYKVASARGFSCEYAALSPADLITADGVWLISSITTAARVRKIDGLVLPPAPRADEIVELVDLAIESGGTEFTED